MKAKKNVSSNVVVLYLSLEYSSINLIKKRIEDKPSECLYNLKQLYYNVHIFILMKLNLDLVYIYIDLLFQINITLVDDSNREKVYLF